MIPNFEARQYRMVISDLDGTLKDINAPLDPDIPSLIAALDRAGVLFTIATGKNLNSTEKTARELGIKLPLILSNGCTLQNLDGTIIDQAQLPFNFVLQLIGICEEMDIDLAIHINEEIYVREITRNVSILFDYGAPNLVETGSWSRIHNLLPKAYKCIAIDRDDRRRLFALERAVIDAFHSDVEYCHTLVEMLEFMPQGISKVSGINALAAMLKVEMHSIIAMGDGNNDIGMLKACGLGLATANAPLPVREAATAVIPSCAENGPKEFLRTLLQQMK